MGEVRIMDPLIQRELDIITLTMVRLQGGQRGGEQATSTGTRDETGQLAGVSLRNRNGEDRNGTDKQTDNQTDRQSDELHW